MISRIPNQLMLQCMNSDDWQYLAPTSLGRGLIEQHSTPPSLQFPAIKEKLTVEAELLG